MRGSVLIAFFYSGFLFYFLLLSLFCHYTSAKKNKTSLFFSFILLAVVTTSAEIRAILFLPPSGCHRRYYFVADFASFILVSGLYDILKILGKNRHGVYLCLDLYPAIHEPDLDSFWCPLFLQPFHGRWGLMVFWRRG